ncbi:hypothetical protein EGW08_020907 [Elysia chlorotica]|uniref:Uncharacterized protein n=1 Tax=Elysia chlorotica TaxID=188477 RepID=A0A433SQ19_ELYCH|nr:hypothetical protein EGW08_020907 [Elysia chlorotica]
MITQSPCRGKVLAGASHPWRALEICDSAPDLMAVSSVRHAYSTRDLRLCLRLSGYLHPPRRALEIWVSALGLVAVSSVAGGLCCRRPGGEGGGLQNKVCPVQPGGCPFIEHFVLFLPGRFPCDKCLVFLLRCCCLWVGEDLFIYVPQVL